MENNYTKETVNKDKSIDDKTKTNDSDKNKTKKRKIKFITKDSLKDFTLWVVVSLILFFVMEYLSRRSRIEKVEVFLKDNTYATVINILLILGITGIIFFVKHKKAVLWFISFLFIGLAVVSRMILEFRGMPVAFMDLYALQDGLSIASRFINTKMIIIAVVVVVLFLVGLVVMWKLDKKSKRFNGISNIVAWMLSILVFAVSIGPIKAKNIMHNIGWDVQATYELNGFLYSILDSYFGYLRKPPEGYSKEAIAKIREEVDKKAAEDKRTIKTGKDVPNVVIVQLEGFMDPTKIPNVNLSIDPIPNFRKLAEKNTSGYMNVPTTGGGTARTEFEVITGNNFDNLLSGEIPYTSIVKEKTSNSLATALKKQGFTAHALHNFKGNFYNRNKGFKNLGYDTFTSVEYMNGLEYTALDWPKDYVLTNYMKKALDSTEGKDFITTVSVQGHSNYPTEKVDEDYPCKITGDIEDKYKNQLYYYCEQVREMDEFIKQFNDMLTQRKEETGEDTIVLYYGDHMPKLDYLYDGEEYLNRYESPYTYFATFDIPKEENAITDAFQAGTELLKLGGVEYGPIEKLHAYLRNDKDYLKKVQLVEYDILFGEKYYLKDDETQKKNTIKMGIDDIKINSAKATGDTLTVEGQNFTARSFVYLNEKMLETTMESPGKLTAKLNGELKKGDTITVKQLGENDAELSSTPEFKIK